MAASIVKKGKLIIHPFPFSQIKNLAGPEDEFLIKILHDILEQGITDLPKRTGYVNLCGLIIGQKIRFSLARERRKKLYILMGSDKFQPSDMLNIEYYKLIEAVGEISAQRIINLTHSFLENKISDEELINIDGIGPWTIKASKLMTNSSNLEEADFILHEDKVVSKLLSTAYPDLNLKCIIKHLEKFSPYRGYISWYLWRSVAS